MDIFYPAKYARAGSGEWNKKTQPNCQRKLNFNWATDSPKLPNVRLSPAEKTNNLSSNSNRRLSYCPVSNKDTPADLREKKRTVARRSLIGSLSAPMKTTGVVRTNVIGRNSESPPRGHPNGKAFTGLDYFNRKRDNENLQGVDKMENIFQKRLDLKLQKPTPYKSHPSRVHLQDSGHNLIGDIRNNYENKSPGNSSLDKRHTENSTLRKPFLRTSDVAQLSDIHDMVSDNTSDATLTGGLVGQQTQKIQRVDWSQHRPLTPSLLKKLNNMKLSTITKTQHWVNQIPQDNTWSSRQISAGACAETSWGSSKNTAPGRVHHPWIYGGGR